MKEEKKYKELMEEFRHHYFKKYDVKLDNEVIYLFIRINELHHDLKKDIKAVERTKLETGWDCFLYGMGKTILPSLAALLFGFIILLFRR